MSDDIFQEQLKVEIAKGIRISNKPSDILKHVRKQYPKAKSRELALAAFALMIEVADQDGELAAALCEFGLSERGSYEATELG